MHQSQPLYVLLLFPTNTWHHQYRIYLHVLHGWLYDQYLPYADDINTDHACRRPPCLPSDTRDAPLTGAIDPQWPHHLTLMPPSHLTILPPESTLSAADLQPQHHRSHHPTVIHYTTKYIFSHSDIPLSLAFPTPNHISFNLRSTSQDPRDSHNKEKHSILKFVQSQPVHHSVSVLVFEVCVDVPNLFDLLYYNQTLCYQAIG